MTRIAVLLQTCNRLDYTRLTLESFVHHNDPSRFLLLHGDDASDEPVVALAQAFGFETVVQNYTRLGVNVTRRALMHAAAARRARWVLMLENDIETLRPFPWELFEFVRKNRQIYCLRLFGAFKDAAKTMACKPTHKWQPGVPIDWRPLRNAPEKAQVANAHWTPLPAVTRIREAVAIHEGHRPDSLTVRVKKNAMAHVGIERTPGRLL